MRETNQALIRALTTQFQSGNNNFRSPAEYVNIKRPITAENFFVSQGKLPNIISIEIDEDIETTAKSFTIVCSNEDGQLSPDYKEGKFGERRLNYQIPLSSPWRNVLVPDTELEISLGYGDNLLKMLIGSIDEVSISADGRTITINGRSNYKKAQVNTCMPKSKKYLIDDVDMNVGVAIKKFLDHVNIPNDIEPNIKEPFTGMSYKVGEKMGIRGEYPHDHVGNMAFTTYYALIESSNGKVKTKKLPDFKKLGKAVVTFDDYIDLTEADYSMDNNEVFDTITVVSKSKEYEIVNGKRKKVTRTIKNRFTSAKIRSDILQGKRRELIVESSWANTPKKQFNTAKALFTKMVMGWKRLSIGVPAYLPLELLDVVSVRERITQVTKRMYVRGIRTSYSGTGLTQVIELADNTRFDLDIVLPPTPPSDMPEFSTTESRLIINIFDFKIEDGDRMNIYLNGRKIVNNLFVRNKGTDIKIDLEKGANVIKFVGISAGKLQKLTASFKVAGGSGNIIYPAGKLPSLNMPRENIASESTGRYITSKRPVRNWVIHRV
ncbi:hypothetical protein ABE042_20295 [Viridibacillus arvi]|uniref:hypothetical protein n=1 Tax=Viridibacillus arvi TaxID=263475 RepID=UPI003D299B5A